MNRLSAASADIVRFLYGTLLSFCLLSFGLRLNLLVEAGRKFHVPYFFAALAVFITLGLGIHIAVDFLRFRKTRWLLLLSLFFSFYFFVLQLGLTISAAASSCKCTTLTDAVARVPDWSRVYLGLLLLPVSSALFLLMKYGGPGCRGH